MIERNTIYAVAILMTLFIGYQFYYDWRFGDFIRERQAAEEAAAPEAETAPTETSVATAVEEATPEPVAADAPDLPVATPANEATAGATPLSDTREKTITLDTGVAEVVLTNRGGAPIHYTLKRYHGPDGVPVDLIFNYDEFIKKQAASEGDTVFKKPITYPTLGLTFPRESFAKKVNNAYYAVVKTEGDLTLTDGPYTIVYAYRDDSGIEVRKSYTFTPGKYTFDFSVSVVSNARWGTFDYGLIWYGLNDELNEMIGLTSYTGPVLLANKERFANAPDDEKPSETYTGAIDWAALTNRYYTAVTIPVSGEKKTVVTRYLEPSNYILEWKFAATIDEAPNTFKVYVGPKAHKDIEPLGMGIPSVIDYGWFDIIAKPLYSLLSWFHTMTGNWGWSIILLTMVMKILFFPLSQKSFRSMRKMQQLAPQVKKLQETYKGDKEKLNAAMLTLYREHQVNPLGGCLPMVAQIPIFFALYKVLLESIELKGAGWVLWITDLGVQDPYYITPVLMGVTMLIQQLMAPKTGDPLQRKMMMALPFVFTFLFLSFPAGLVLYWLVNNILTIAQQAIIYREADKPKKA